MGFIFDQMKNHSILIEMRMFFFFSWLTLCYNHMSLLIWTVFLGEQCGPWASCWVVGPMMAQCMLADCNGFIFFNTIVILITQQVGESKDSFSHFGPTLVQCHIWKRVFRIKSAYAGFVGLTTLDHHSFDRWEKMTSSQRQVSTLDQQYCQQNANLSERMTAAWGLFISSLTTKAFSFKLTTVYHKSNAPLIKTHFLCTV